LREGVKDLVVGDPLCEQTDVGPLIRRADRNRVREWIDEAVCAGAEVLAGGELVDGEPCLAPVIVNARSSRCPSSPVHR